MDLPQPPQDTELRNIIDKLAQFVARNGPEFEQMTKNKQKGNPKFQFLYGGEYYNYYQYKVSTEQALHKQQQQQNVIQPQQNIWSLSTSTVNGDVEHITQQIETLQEQIKQSEHNLQAQHAVLLQQQQTQMETVILESEKVELQKEAEDSQISLDELHQILQPIVDSCTKDSIQTGKSWILQHATNRTQAFCIAHCLLQKAMQPGALFPQRLHVIYLVNDVLHHCARKNAADLKDALESVVVAMFCGAANAASDEQRLKLDKLLQLWESKANYLAASTVEALRRPQESLQQYISQQMAKYGGEIARVTQATFEGYRVQHQAFVCHATQQIQEFELRLSALEEQHQQQQQQQQQQQMQQHQQLQQHQMSPQQSHMQKQQQPPPPPPSSVQQQQQQPPQLQSPQIQPPQLQPPQLQPPQLQPPQLQPPPLQPPQLQPSQLQPPQLQPPQLQPPQLQPPQLQPPQLQPPQLQPPQHQPPQHQPPQHQPPQLQAPQLQPPPQTQQPPPTHITPQIPPPNTSIPPPQFNQPPPGFFSPPGLFPDFSKPPPGFLPQPEPPVPEELMPSLPYYELPAGLMVPLIKLEDTAFKSLDPSAIRLPPPAPPNERLLAAVEAFYAPPSHERPRDSEGWEKLGLYEYYKAKNIAKKEKEEQISAGYRNKSRSPSPIQVMPDKSPSPPRRRYVSRSPTPNRRSRSRSPRRQRRSRSSRSRKTRSPSPRSRSRTPSPIVPALVVQTQEQLDSSNKGHQMLKRMGWGGSGLGAHEQGIDAPISGGDVRDRQDQFKGVGCSLNDPYENFRKNKGAAFITRMKARAEERAQESRAFEKE